jgi:pilus assembly protein Flp/PilA
MKTRTTRFGRDASGATAIEYGLIALLVAVAIIVGATALGSQLNSTYKSFSAGMSSAEAGNNEILR